MSSNAATFRQAVDYHSKEQSRFLAKIKEADEQGKLSQFPVYADEEFGQLSYCEQNGVFSRNRNEQKTGIVEKTATVNEASKDTIPTSTVPREINDEMLKNDGRGAFVNYHPTLAQNDL